MHLPTDRKTVTIGVGILAAVLLVALGAAWWSFRSREARFVDSAQAAASSSPQVAATSTDPLTGLPHAEASSTRPVAVMIEQHVDARPISGVAQASLVVEAPVEGGITRLMAVFEDAADAKEIGPVRSARPYYVDWADELDAVYAHVGGSPDALDRIKAVGTRDLNQFFWGDFFWRATSREAPHNVYTSSTLLSAARAVRGFDDPWTIDAWRFSTSSDRTTSSTAVTIPFSSPSYRVVWRWEPRIGKWLRSLGGASAFDRDGRPEEATDVAVAFTDTRVVDDYGRIAVTTVGQGRAMMLRDGRVVTGTWRKPSRTARLRFYGADGNEFSWAPGVAWIEIVPSGITVTTTE